MFIQNPCRRCNGFDALNMQEGTFLKGRFKKLCTVCRSKSSDDMDQDKAGLHDVFESFVIFTCDYGAIIGFVFCTWIVYASFHHAQPVRSDVVAASKRPMIVMVQN